MQNKIDNIMDNFNFAKVEKAIQATGWRWASVEGTPEESDLRKQARRLLKEVSVKYVKESDFRCYISTGGFKATKYFDGELELEFIMASWETSE